MVLSTEIMEASPSKKKRTIKAKMDEAPTYEIVGITLKPTTTWIPVEVQQSSSFQIHQARYKDKEDNEIEIVVIPGKFKTSSSYRRSGHS